MAARCSFCGSTAGPFSKVEGRRLGPASPLGTRAEGARNRQVIAVMRQCQAAGEQVARMYQEPGRPGWSAKPRSPRTWSPSARGQRSVDVVVAHDGRCCVKANQAPLWLWACRPTQASHQDGRPRETIVVRGWPLTCGPSVAQLRLDWPSGADASGALILRLAA
jgi:hypothetical protein